MSRQRDLFPLLHLPLADVAPERRRGARAVLRRQQRKSHAVAWANDGIDALNWLSGRGHVPLGTDLPGSSHAALEHIRGAYIAAGGPPPEDSPEGALRALLGSSRVYAQDRSDLQPYVRDRVSWPAVGSVPVDLGPPLDEAGKLDFDG